MSARRIVFINRFFSPDQSATSQLVSDLAFDLAPDHNVVVVASRLKHDDPAARLPRQEVIGGVKVVRVASTGFGRAGIVGRAIDLLSFYVFAWFKLLGLARRGDVLVAKTDPPLLSILAAGIAAIRGAVVVNWLQDVYPEVAVVLGVKGLAGFAGRRLADWRDVSLNAAAINVVLGERMAAYLRGRDVPSCKIRIIQNWSDEAAITPTARADNPLRQAWGLGDRFVVAYSGNLGRAHEYEAMLEAAQILKDEPSIVFLMIGAGKKLAELRERAGAACLANVVFQPFQDQSHLADSLGVGDVHWLSLIPDLEGLIVPSKTYGVFAAGRPLIAVTEADGEVARLGRALGCGVQVQPGDGQAFAASVRRLASDPVLVAQMGDAARAAASGPLSRRAALTAWRDVLREALDAAG